jgi:rfaE bifunctional protein kinase chain/domain
MNRNRFDEITSRYSSLSVALLGDFCLDRYLEIDPARQETSIETGLPVHNVVRVRAQPGGAGTVLNNLVALGIGTIIPLGFAGDDGEGFELCRSLRALPGVRLDWFLQTPLRRTFTYCKPLIVESGQPPHELNRLDSKNWTPTPAEVASHLTSALKHQVGHIDALVILEQVDLADTGVITRQVLEAVGEIATARPQLRILADSRRSLLGYPPVSLKMNRAELKMLLDGAPMADLDQTKRGAQDLARRCGHEVFVTLAEQGILGATPGGELAHFAALPTRGQVDIVGAGDAVTANLTAALAAGATPTEALELANTAASIVIHQLGTTGTASVGQLAQTLGYG